MKVSLRRSHIGRLFALAVIFALLPLPALADQESAKPAPGIRVSAATIATTEPLAANETAQAGAPAGTDSPSFFKSPAGIVTLVLVAVGVGRAIYSTKNDRIKSPGR